MTFAAHPIEANISKAARIWRLVQSRYALVGAYVLALLLTAIAILLAASPPETGEPEHSDHPWLQPGFDPVPGCGGWHSLAGAFRRAI